MSQTHTAFLKYEVTKVDKIPCAYGRNGLSPGTGKAG